MLLEFSSGWDWIYEAHYQMKTAFEKKFTSISAQKVFCKCQRDERIVIFLESFLQNIQIHYIFEILTQVCDCGLRNEKTFRKSFMEIFLWMHVAIHFISSIFLPPSFILPLYFNKLNIFRFCLTCLKPLKLFKTFQFSNYYLATFLWLR